MLEVLKRDLQVYHREQKCQQTEYFTDQEDFFKQQTFKSKTKRLSSRPQAVGKLMDDENQTDADAGSYLFWTVCR